VDLDAILAKGWADPDDLTPAEFAAAEAFWRARRAHDDQLQATFDAASALVRRWTGCTPLDVGSFGTRLNLQSSDLDLGIGYPVENRSDLREALAAHTTFKDERYTRFDTTRLVFAFTCQGIDIDVSALAEEDFTVATRMLDQISSGMTREDRIAHTWIKNHLLQAGRTDDYARWKLVVYARYCPEFNWVPIPRSAPIALPESPARTAIH
jgi:hypothetical protein